jgi:uncharacterized membrane protein YbhN (UPF0104 family)
LGYWAKQYDDRPAEEVDVVLWVCFQTPNVFDCWLFHSNLSIFGWLFVPAMFLSSESIQSQSFSSRALLLLLYSSTLCLDSWERRRWSIKTSSTQCSLRRWGSLFFILSFEAFLDFFALLDGLTSPQHPVSLPV